MMHAEHDKEDHGEMAKKMMAEMMAEHHSGKSRVSMMKGKKMGKMEME